MPPHPHAAGAMVVLGLRAPSLAEVRAVAPLAGPTVTVAPHPWRRTALLGVLAGTAVRVAPSGTLLAP
ncbi:hypothetical protein [Streptomyces caelestis]|uniref:hypothetical protein n=1 Tax=Streptomyces caelestis TaxID=36816 RepID=UPI0036574691